MHMAPFALRHGNRVPNPVCTLPEKAPELPRENPRGQPTYLSVADPPRLRSLVCADAAERARVSGGKRERGRQTLSC